MPRWFSRFLTCSARPWPSRPVVDDRDVAVAPAVCQIVPGEGALAVVATDDLKDVTVLVFGQPRVGRAGLDHEDAGAPVDLGCGNRRARAGGAEGDGDCLTDELLRRERRQFSIAAVIDQNQPQWFAQNAALGVEVSDCQLGAGQMRLADPGVRAGQGGAEADRNFRSHMIRRLRPQA